MVLRRQVYTRDGNLDVAGAWRQGVAEILGAGRLLCIAVWGLSGTAGVGSWVLTREGVKGA